MNSIGSKRKYVVWTLILSFALATLLYGLHAASQRSAGIEEQPGSPTVVVRGALKCFRYITQQQSLRDWSLRPLTILDLTKANREKEFPDVRRPKARDLDRAQRR